MKKTKFYILIIFFVIVFLVFIGLYRETGIFQKSKIDFRDLSYWNYSNGYMVGSGSILYSGNNKTCWILVHSYGATPKEMSPLAVSISNELNQTVFVPLLLGHGTVPSDLESLSLENWYNQIDNYVDEYSSSCEKINILGSSLSAPLVLKIAEEKNISKVFVLNSFIYMPYKLIRVLPLKWYFYTITPFTHYNKKIEIAKINDKQNQVNHLAYWNMPYDPIKDSFNFIDDTTENLNKINSDVFIAHSHFDPTASKYSAEIIYDRVNSSIKELNWYDNSSHVLLLDYDRDTLIRDIIDFELNID